MSWSNVEGFAGRRNNNNGVSRNYSGLTARQDGARAAGAARRCCIERGGRVVRVGAGRAGACRSWLQGGRQPACCSRPVQWRPAASQSASSAHSDGSVLLARRHGLARPGTRSPPGASPPPAICSHVEAWGSRGGRPCSQPASAVALLYGRSSVDHPFYPVLAAGAPGLAAVAHCLAHLNTFPARGDRP